MTDGKYKLEIKLERIADAIWRFIIYLTTKPKDKFEVMDKHALIIEILSFILMGVAILIRIRG